MEDKSQEPSQEALELVKALTRSKEPFNDTYWEALSSAFTELEHVKKEEKRLVIRKAQLKETIKALWPLVSMEHFDINSMTLSNAIRLIYSGADRPLSAVDVRGKLQDLGFNLEQFDNPLANIHTAIRRMADGDELKLIDEEKKKFGVGPELKPPIAPPTVEGDK